MQGVSKHTATPDTAEQVVSAEKQFIKTRRRASTPLQSTEPNHKTSDQFWGLSLSGGGIRSAAFATGVLQGLVKTKLLKDIDYLSTVSGGGYIGSALTWASRGNGRGNWQPLTADNFPLGVRDQSGARSGHKRGFLLNYIRQHGNYLTPGEGLKSMALLATTIRAVFSAVFAYFPMILLFALLVLGIGDLGVLGDLVTYVQNLLASSSVVLQKEVPGFTAYVLGLNIYNLVAYGLVIVFLGLTALYSFWSYKFLFSNKTRFYQFRVVSQRFGGRVLSLSVVCGIVGSIPFVFGEQGLFYVLHGFVLSGAGGAEKFSSHAPVATGSVTFMAVVKWSYDHVQKNSGKIPSAMVASPVYKAVMIGLIIYGLAGFSYLVAGKLLAEQKLFDFSPATHWNIIIVLLVWTVAYGAFTNLNYVSLHRMYRDRLMEAFMPDDGVEDKHWSYATHSNVQPLSAMCGEHSSGPYHLINCNAVLLNSNNPKFSGRGGDSFILSPKFVGSDATGYRATEFYQGDAMTLSTAMAASAASINPGVNVGLSEFFRSRGVSFLMTLLNLRLGFWAKNPRHLSWAATFNPNYLRPGLKSLLGWGMSENATESNVELTDGGHFENLGAYELIRRRLELIVMVDAGEDSHFNFEDLAVFCGKVQVDFDVCISFGDLSLDKMVPSKDSNFGYKVAQQGYAVANIEYGAESSGPAKTGTLIYIKPTMVDALPPSIVGYNCANPAFPHQSTSDQFANEVQFEAYRELGFQLTDAAVKKLPASVFKTAPNNKHPTPIPDESLA